MFVTLTLFAEDRDLGSSSRRFSPLSLASSPRQPPLALPRSDQDPPLPPEFLSADDHLEVVPELAQVLPPPPPPPPLPWSGQDFWAFLSQLSFAAPPPPPLFHEESQFSFGLDDQLSLFLSPFQLSFGAQEEPPAAPPTAPVHLALLPPPPEAARPQLSSLDHPFFSVVSPFLPRVIISSRLRSRASDGVSASFSCGAEPMGLE
mmetsp:Transcript_56346/g.150675  ORF Transcript_56346/g.150675 Transcript_56346/m.150675 type:complete len:204 (-) Transcript_56346:187-798(-)